MKIRTLLENIPYTLVQGSVDREISGICHDNRRLHPQDAFICISGAHFDTHSIAGELVKAGVGMLVTEKPVQLPENSDVTVIRVSDTRTVSPLLSAAFYGHPARHLVTIGITGSKGKTTTTHMMADILRCAGFLTGTIGTNGAIMPVTAEGVEPVYGEGENRPVPCAETPGYECYELDNTTPDAMEIQRYLAMMVKRGCTHAVVEVSSQAMKQHRADGILFDYGIWTNIETGDHIGPNEHKDFEEYLACKAGLLNISRTCFVNADDPHLEAFLKYVEKPVHFFGCMDKADFKACDLEAEFNEVTREPGIAFRVECSLPGKTESGQYHIRVNLPGTFNMYNALAAVCVSNCLGIPEAVINQALTHLRIRGRFDFAWSCDRFRVCVDFAHNGYSTRNHLQALREYRPKRLVCVFGADGNRSVYRRLEMGEASARYADLSIVTAGHNRYETFENICCDILRGIETAEKDMGKEADYIVIPNRQKAIRFAIDHAQEGDIITILGLGHESYQEANGIKTPHSDIEFVKAYCSECEKKK